MLPSLVRTKKTVYRLPLFFFQNVYSTDHSPFSTAGDGEAAQLNSVGIHWRYYDSVVCFKTYYSF